MASRSRYPPTYYAKHKESKKRNDLAPSFGGRQHQPTHNGYKPSYNYKNNSFPQKNVKKDANFNDAASVSTISSVQSFRAKLREDSSESDENSDFENTLDNISETS